VAVYQVQPEGLGLFFRPAALSFTHVVQLHIAHSALPDEKIASAGSIGLVLTGPSSPSDQSLSRVLREEGWICLRGIFPAPSLEPFLAVAATAYGEVDAVRKTHGEAAYLQHLPGDLRYVPTASSFPLHGLHPGLGGWLDTLPAQLKRLLHGELGESVACDIDQAWLRRQYAPGRGHRLHHPHAWHQDGALGYDFTATGRERSDELLEMLVCWIPLTPCGERAPGLELYCERFSEVLPIARLNEAAMPGGYSPEDCRRPVMQPGDVLLFAGDLLHRTYRSDVMKQDRTSIEFRFFNGSALPRRLAEDRFHAI
jgi:hypothetical protein